MAGSPTSRRGFSRGTALALALLVAMVIGLFVWRSEEASTNEDHTGLEERSLRDRDRFASIPKIDVHVHVDLDVVDTALAVFRRQGIAMALNASGGHPGPALDRSLAVARRSSGRLRPYCNVSFELAGTDQFESYAMETVRACAERGGVGIKIFKHLGLGATKPDGELLAIDDQSIDPLFEAAGRHHLPVLIHSGDPKAFFEPPTPDNERYEELSAHPSWSFYGERPGGGEWPRWETLLDQLETRIARHPGTTFVGAHFGNAAEEPDRVARMLSSYPNYYVETGARVPEMGRHPPDRMRALFMRYARRILFGSDLQIGSYGVVLGSSGAEPDDPARIPFFFDAHFRYFETDRRGLSHPTPIQGDWTIDGIDLPRTVLERLYYKNAAEVYGIELPKTFSATY